MRAETDSLADRARRYLDALERFATGDELAAFFTPDVVQEEFPNRLVPNGARRNLSDILAGAERGRALLASQRFEILSAIADRDRIALEVVWTATLAIPVGTVPAGGSMRARFGVFLEYRDGRIAAQRNYDCFDPF